MGTVCQATRAAWVWIAPCPLDPAAFEARMHITKWMKSENMVILLPLATVASLVSMGVS